MPPKPITSPLLRLTRWHETTRQAQCRQLIASLPHLRQTRPLSVTSNLFVHSRSTSAYATTIARTRTPDRPVIILTTRRALSTTTQPPLKPTPLTQTAYHNLSTTTLDNLLSSLEDIAESSPSEESNDQLITDVEFSAGVLTVQVEGKGTWVINKQPPNKQIWLSSPVSGPRRFDWIGEDGNEGNGAWVCLREGDEVGLGELLRRELGVGIRVGEDGEEN